jgi:hypothetical protein
MRSILLVLAVAACSKPAPPNFKGAVCATAAKSFDDVASAANSTAQPDPNLDDEMARCIMLDQSIVSAYAASQAVSAFVGALQQPEPDQAAAVRLEFSSSSIQLRSAMQHPCIVMVPRDKPIGATQEAAKRVLAAVEEARKAMTAKGCP